MDVSDALTSDDAVKAIRSAFENEGVLNKDLVKVRLDGETEMDVHFDTGYIAHLLNDEYYLVRVKDETRTKIDYNRFAADMSLKGEYVRMVKGAVDAGEVTESEAASMIALGVRLLSGEEKLS